MTMSLRGENGDVEFELALIEQRFEDIQDEEGDDRFATLSFRVGAGDEAWEETAPSINMFQLRSLLDWLDAVAEAGPSLDRVELLEANLSFDVEDETDEAVTIVVGFHLEDRPEWAVIDAPTTEAGYIRFRMPREEVAVAARELRDDLQSLGWA